MSGSTGFPEGSVLASILQTKGLEIVEIKIIKAFDFPRIYSSPLVSYEFFGILEKFDPPLLLPSLTGQKFKEVYEKEIIEGEKKMLIFEDEFDKATTECNEDQEKLESLSKTQNDAELQLGALKRRKQLIEEELERCEKRAGEFFECM